jgi:hypothetical protein
MKTLEMLNFNTVDLKDEEIMLIDGGYKGTSRGGIDYAGFYQDFVLGFVTGLFDL